MYDSRQYLIFNVSELDKIDFNEVMETSPETVRKSVDESKTFVKWEGDRPSSTLQLQTAEGPYSHEQILNILDSEEWSNKMGMISYGNRV